MMRSEGGMSYATSLPNNFSTWSTLNDHQQASTLAPDTRGTVPAIMETFLQEIVEELQARAHYDFLRLLESHFSITCVPDIIQLPVTTLLQGVKADAGRTAYEEFERRLYCTLE